MGEAPRATSVVGRAGGGTVRRSTTARPCAMSRGSWKRTGGEIGNRLAASVLCALVAGGAASAPSPKGEVPKEAVEVAPRIVASGRFRSSGRSPSSSPRRIPRAGLPARAEWVMLATLSNPVSRAPSCWRGPWARLVGWGWSCGTEVEPCGSRTEVAGDPCE